MTVVQFLWDPAALFRSTAVTDGSCFGLFARLSVLTSTFVASPWLAATAARAIVSAPDVSPAMFVGLTVIIFCVWVVVAGVGFAIMIAIFALMHAVIIKPWAACLGVRADTPARSIVGHTVCVAFLFASLAFPAALIVAILTEFWLFALFAFALFLILGALALFRGVHIGLRELRYANPPPLAQQSEDAAPALQ